MMDTRRQRRIQQVVDKKKKEVAETHMNKDFLNKMNDDGTYHYPLAEKIYKWKFNMIDQIQDDMRICAAYYGNIKQLHAKNQSLKKQLIIKEITEKDQHGMLMTDIDVNNTMIANNINIYRNIAKLRDHILNTFIAKIDGEVLTGEAFNKFAEYYMLKLKELGYDMLPERFEPILPE